MEYGELKIRVEECAPETLSAVSTLPDPRDRYLVVDRAPERSTASGQMVEQLIAEGYIVDDVLTVGTVGRGVGVVRYRVEPMPGPPYYFELTRLESDEYDR